jgi:hypothetical protein
MTPSTHRALTVLLASRHDLPPALADELDAWKHALDASQPPATRAARPASPARASAAAARESACGLTTTDPTTNPKR